MSIRWTKVSEADAGAGLLREGVPMKGVMSRRTALGSCLVLMLVTMVISSAGCFATSVVLGAIAHLGRCVFACDPAIRALDAAFVRSCLEGSLWLGLLLSPVGWVLFLADLRRQRWL